MDVKLKLAGRTLVVRMKGELDHHVAEGMRKQLDVKLAGDRIKHILFNFQDVIFMDSSGLGMVLGRYRNVTEKGGRAVACSLHPAVKRVFDLSGLESRIPVFATEQEALRNVEGGKSWTIT